MKQIGLLLSFLFIPIFAIDLPKIYAPKDVQRIREILQVLEAKNLEQGVVKVKELKNPDPNYGKLLEALNSKSLPDALKQVTDLKTKNTQINDALGKQQKELYQLKEENISLKNKLAERTQEPGIPTAPPLPPTTGPDRPYLEDIKKAKTLTSATPSKPTEKTEREKLLEGIQKGKTLKPPSQQPTSPKPRSDSLEDVLKRAMQDRRGPIAGAEADNNSQDTDPEWD